MNAARRILLLGGIALVVLGMGHGTWYAVFAEHQALDRMGGSLATAFTRAAEGKVEESATALAEYREAKYVHERQVDAHGHWIGLAMLLIVIGFAFDRVGFSEKQRQALAVGLVMGAVLFPLSVLLQTASHGPIPRGLSIASSGLMIAALAAAAVGFAMGSSDAREAK